MKRYVYGAEYIQAMATINPKFCNLHTIQGEVEQRDEGSIPHMHIYWDKSRNPKKCSYVRLDEVAYSDHHKICPKLPKTIKDEFVELMNNEWVGHFIPDKNGNPVKCTGYQAAVHIWVETFEDGDYSKFTVDENGIPVQLDYSTL